MPVNLSSIWPRLILAFGPSNEWFRKYPWRGLNLPTANQSCPTDYWLEKIARFNIKFWMVGKDKKQFPMMQLVRCWRFRPSDALGRLGHEINPLIKQQVTHRARPLKFKIFDWRPMKNWWITCFIFMLIVPSGSSKSFFWHFNKTDTFWIRSAMTILNRKTHYRLKNGHLSNSTIYLRYTVIDRWHCLNWLVQVPTKSPCD